MTIVLAHGCFDIFHFGHLRHLQKAKSLGDMLIVSVTSDKFVGKGDGRPLFTIKQRTALLRALSMVDKVVISNAPTPDKIIKRWKPHVYVKGIEYKGKLPEQALVESHGGKVVFTNEAVYSSTKLCSSL